MASRYDMNVDRWTTFERVLTFANVDLTNATLTMQVRLTPDAPGDPLISLALVTEDGAEGFFPIAFSPLQSKLHLVISAATLADPAHAPKANVAGQIVKLAYDLVVQLPGAAAHVWLYGDFNVIPGVTR